MFRQDITSLPPQKKSTAAKYKNGKEWFRENVDAYESHALFYERESHRKMQVYFDLDDDIINQEEIEKVFNPLGLDTNSFPTNLKNYPLSVPKIDLLQGEEIKRRFDWMVTARNQNSESSDNSQLMDMLMEISIDELTKSSYSEEEAQKRVQEFSKYAKYSWKDANEITATKILQYLWRQQDLQAKFNKNFRKALLAAREIYRIDIEGNEPIVHESDPRNVFIIRKGSSEKIEDAEAIVEITYEPMGKVVDTYYDHLKPSEIDELENGRFSTSTRGSSGDSSVLNYNNKLPQIYSNLDLGSGNGFIDINELHEQEYSIGLPYDSEGNIRVVRCRWMGRKKIGILTFFDEDGDEQEKVVSEYYKINADLGEHVKWIWVNEAYEATKIGYDIYVKMQPREVQMRHFDNKSKCFLGYVGTDYGKSLMSRMEPYQYAYNVYMSKLELTMAKYKGPIYDLELDKIPDDWKVEEWLYYADILGWAVKDNFNEGKKGSATGKLAGNFNTGGKVMDSNAGNYIQQIVTMLQYIEKQMGQIAGVSEQRLGQVENRETVGGVERAVTQSSHITEKWFFMHDETKKRVLNALLDTAKYAWKDTKSRKVNYTLDDLSRQFLEFNGAEFASTEYDLFATTSSKDMEIRETLKQLTHAAAQNGAGMGMVIDVLNSDSIAEMSRIVEQSEEDTMRRQEQMQKEQMASNEKLAQIQEQSKQADRDLKIYEIDQKTAVEYAKLGVQEDQANQVEVPEDNTLDERKQSLAEQKASEDNAIKQRQLSETERHNKAAESISKNKPKSSK